MVSFNRKVSKERVIEKSAQVIMSGSFSEPKGGKLRVIGGRKVVRPCTLKGYEDRQAAEITLGVSNHDPQAGIA